MGREEKISCDQCDKDLTNTGNSIDYRLALIVERKPSRGGFVTDVMIYPPIDRDKYFCGMGCLKLWISAAPQTKG